MNTRNISRLVGAALCAAITIIVSGCGTIRHGRARQALPPPITVSTPAPAKAPNTAPATATAQAQVSGPVTGPQYLSLNATTGPGGITTPQAVSFDTNAWTGMVGGVPCLFGNQTKEDVTLSVKDNGGSTFTIELGAGVSNLVYNIMLGNYSYTYWTGRNMAEQPSRNLVVNRNPCHTIYRVGSYHAVVIFRP